MLAGAQAQLQAPAIYTHEAMRGATLSFPGGDIDPGQAVCSDIVVRALRSASIALQALIYEDRLLQWHKWTGIAVATSMNLVSGIGRTFVSVRDAQQMRGWRPRGLRSWNEVLVPVVLTAIEDSVLLAEAMEARGFGAGRRTSYSRTSWTRLDVAVAASALAAAMLFVGARLAGVAMDWYPYPTLALPPIQPVLALGCLVLALPALRRG